MKGGYGTNLNLKGSLVWLIYIYIACLHQKDTCEVNVIDQKTFLYTLSSYSEFSFLQRLKQLWLEVCLFSAATLNFVLHSMHDAPLPIGRSNLLLNQHWFIQNKSLRFIALKFIFFGFVDLCFGTHVDDSPISLNKIC